jgi:hypothetical protein
MMYLYCGPPMQFLSGVDMLEGIDWRMPRRTWRPELAG